MEKTEGEEMKRKERLRVRKSQTERRGEKGDFGGKNEKGYKKGES